jgi:hypothetical protein
VILSYFSTGKCSEQKGLKVFHSDCHNGKLVGLQIRSSAEKYPLVYTHGRVLTWVQLIFRESSLSPRFLSYLCSSMMKTHARYHLIYFFFSSTARTQKDFLFKGLVKTRANYMHPHYSQL